MLRLPQSLARKCQGSHPNLHQTHKTQHAYSVARQFNHLSLSINLIQPFIWKLIALETYLFLKQIRWLTEKMNNQSQLALVFRFCICIFTDTTRVFSSLPHKTVLCIHPHSSHTHYIMIKKETVSKKLSFTGCKISWGQLFFIFFIVHVICPWQFKINVQSW